MQPSSRWCGFLDRPEAQPLGRRHPRRHRGAGAWDVDGVRSGPRCPPLGQRHVFDVGFPIDVVYTWVDGSDPAWLERKSAGHSEAGRPAHTTVASNESRFLTRDELRYSLRSLDMYADWVRHIYLVTDDQVPAVARHRPTRGSPSSATASSSATAGGCRRSTRTPSSPSCTASRA